MEEETSRKPAQQQEPTWEIYSGFNKISGLQKPSFLEKLNEYLRKFLPEEVRS